MLKDARFADDHAMVAETENALQIIMNRINEVSQLCRMKINIKLKVMVISRQGCRIVHITKW